MSFIEQEFSLHPDDQNTLLKIARQSIQYGLANAAALPLDPDEFSDQLQQVGASFVTLHINKQLRGCIGTLEAYQPLVKDVAEHAYAAAFQDHRFTPLTAQEEPLLDIHISILSPAQAMTFTSEQDLIQQIRPGIDGLILESGNNRGTFLPSVWEGIKDPAVFLQHLKQKAGLATNFWDANIKVSRYTTLSIYENNL